MKTETNHFYIGREDRLIQWAGITEDNDEKNELTEECVSKLVAKIKELIKNYLQLDNVNFLFGTGSSIHLGAASIQNIPEQAEKDILESGNDNLKEDFKEYVQRLQKVLKGEKNPEKDEVFKDYRGWNVIFDGTYIRDYKAKIDLTDGEEDTPDKHYGGICVMYELLLNYLTAISYQKDAENDVDGFERVHALIDALKESLFKICDIHERQTSERDLNRIREKGMEDVFGKNKYIFHEKFLKSLMQRPLNLQRANIFTSNYDLAFEYAFDNLGIKYIDGFSGFHHQKHSIMTFSILAVLQLVKCNV